MQSAISTRMIVNTTRIGVIYTTRTSMISACRIQFPQAKCDSDTTECDFVKYAWDEYTDECNCDI
jgi:hypothetical protein